jgi:D-3-phosphoglycerate dehydrogenase / 2-oxoglutarate reductase
VLAQHEVNIEGQALATRGQLGYLLTDIACDYPSDVVEALAAMPETIRFRVLS